MRSSGKSENGSHEALFCLVACLLLAVLVVSASPARGHDMWLAPSSFEAPIDQPLRVRMWVGHPGEAEPVPRNPGRIERFSALSADGERDVLGLAGSDPAGALRTTSAGLLTLAFRSHDALSVLDAEAFGRYLAEEGLESIAAHRSERGESTEEGREKYSRALKALVAVGGVSGSDRPLGLRLELVAENDPYALRAGEELVARLYFEGEPLAGALVEASRLDDAGEPFSVRTDKSGRARFGFSTTGGWLLATTHMVPLEGDREAEWQSVWASLSFMIPDG